jgi:hypothetical protein
MMMMTMSPHGVNSDNDYHSNPPPPAANEALDCDNDDVDDNYEWGPGGLGLVLIACRKSHRQHTVVIVLFVLWLYLLDGL